MKELLANIDWLYLKKALMVLVVCVSVSSAVAAASYLYLGDKRQLNNSSQANLNNMKTRYQNAVYKLKLVADYLSEYKTLEQKGFVGDENRLEWVETLRRITKDKKVATIDYDIKALQPYTAGKNINASIFQVNTSEMVLQMKLMHERDLLDIFSDLNRQTAGIYDIKGCSMRRQTAKLQFDYKAVNILAECTLNWFTIKAKGNT